jgi:hypothetical protein
VTPFYPPHPNGIEHTSSNAVFGFGAGLDSVCSFRWLQPQPASPPRKSQGWKKIIKKSTYPAPADGICVLLLCKPGCSANEPAAQAARGALQVICNFIDWNVVKKNAERLHSIASLGYERGAVEPLVSLDEKKKNLKLVGFRFLKRSDQGGFVVLAVHVN